MRQVRRVKAPTTPVIIEGQYRVHYARIKRHWHAVVERVEWENGQPVECRSKQPVEILVDISEGSELI